MTTPSPSSAATQPSRSAIVWRAAGELLASMRFAIALLTVICIASVIGTVIKQHEPAVNYVNQFGPFWGELFLALKLNAVYSAWWFLLILAFLVISTSLCIWRNTPKYLADIRSYKENIRENSLKAFHHKAAGALTGAPEAEARRMAHMLGTGGWKVRLQERDTPTGKGWMVAAKAGAVNKIGYIAAHSAIVLICLGGLFDGDLFVRALTWFGGKTVYTGGGFVSQVRPEHRLPENNPAFRGNLVVAEGTQSSTAILNQSDGVLLQELPFAVELKKFIVEHYPSGMPRLFASEIVIHDKETGEQVPQRIEVNHPGHYKGVNIYQSSFDDGGSTVKLRGLPMRDTVQSFEIEGVIGSSSRVSNGEEHFTLEYTGLNVMNVENFARGDRGVDARKVDLRNTLAQRLGAADKTVSQRDLRNVGPSITYKLRDAAGQAREFNNYMLPVDTGDGAPVFLLGARETQAEPFRYLRLPADDEGVMDGFLRLREALQDAEMRQRAVRRYVALSVDGSQPELANQLTDSASRTLRLFAGVETVDGKNVSGLQAISDFMEAAVPEQERERAAGVLLRILNGSLFQLNALAREAAGKKPLDEGEAAQRFMTQSVLALSDLPFYPAPLVFELLEFEHKQASVFQVARAPGKNVVYLGCLLLILGIFAMLYVRERRLWIWLSPEPGTPDGQAAGSHAMMALSTNRKTLDADREFEQLQRKLLATTSSST